jgi:hypothetical protein
MFFDRYKVDDLIEEHGHGSAVTLPSPLRNYWSRFVLSAQ